MLGAAVAAGYVTATRRDDAVQGRMSSVQHAFGRNLTYGLHETLGRAIVVGDYADKPFPNEADIVREHGVSRSVTREAVKMLAAKGLLGARPKQGTFVLPEESWNLLDPDVLRWLLEREASIDLLRHFNELRVGVEPEAAALAACGASEAQQAAISAGLARMVAAERGEDDPLDSDIAFHVAVLRASNNPFFLQFREMVSTALRTSIRFTNRIKGRTANIADHEAVAEAIATGDAAAARAAMHRLIQDVLTLIDGGSIASAGGQGERGGT